MNLITNMFRGAAIVGLGALSLVGCSKQVDSAAYQGEPQTVEEPTPKSYFALVDMWHDSGMTMTNGDFDGDGDLDLVVGAYKSKYGKLYFFENDGEGNFRLKPQSIYYPENYMD